MSYNGVKEQLSQARRGRSLSQAELARRSGTSRVTIARLEGGGEQDVRLATIESLCQALGLELAAAPAGGPAAFEARLSRERARAQRVERKLAHARLAARLLVARPRQAGALVSRARSVVDRWERDRLCSDHYLSRWRAMLSGPVALVARRLLNAGEWEDALFQNTPWSFALGPLAS